MQGRKGDRKKGSGPSSAAKAAELLAASNGGASQTVGFGGFMGSKRVAPAAGSFAFGTDYLQQAGSSSGSGGGDGAGLLDAAAPLLQSADLDPEVGQHLRRLSKRDPLTRSKALAALRTLLPDRGQANALAALPSWTYAYPKLVVDNSRPVRTEAARVQRELAAAAGRKLAPFLGKLIGPWWLSQFDPHSEAAAAARAGFSEAFAGTKQRGALLFCREELLEYLQEQLASSPQSLGDASKETAEELGERHERAVSSALAATSMLMELMSSQAKAASAAGGGLPAAESDLQQRLAALVSCPKFLKQHLSSKSPAVRRAAYHLVATAASLEPDTLRPAVDSASAAVFGAVGDRDPGNLQDMWAMVLAWAEAYGAQAWRSAGGLRKAVLPRLHSLLRHGGYGAPGDAFGPLPTFLKLLLEGDPQQASSQLVGEVLLSVWAGWGALPRVSRAPAASAFTAVLCWALDDAHRLAAWPSSSSSTSTTVTAAAAAFGSDAAEQQQQQQQRAQEYAQDVLRVSLVEKVVPSALRDAPPAGPAALDLLAASLAAACTQCGRGGDSWQARLALRTVGGAAAFCLGSVLGGGEGAGAAAAAAAAGVGAAAAGAEVVFDRTMALAELVVAEGAGGVPRGVAAEELARPVAAPLVPAVAAGAAPAAASRLLAGLIKLYGPGVTAYSSPAPAAGVAAAASSATNVAEGDSVGSAAAAVPAPAGLPFSLDSLVAATLGLLEAGARDVAATASANADLILSCISQQAGGDGLGSAGVGAGAGPAAEAAAAPADLVARPVAAQQPPRISQVIGEELMAPGLQRASAPPPPPPPPCPAAEELGRLLAGLAAPGKGSGGGSAHGGDEGVGLQLATLLLERLAAHWDEEGGKGRGAQAWRSVHLDDLATSVCSTSAAWRSASPGRRRLAGVLLLGDKRSASLLSDAAAEAVMLGAAEVLIDAVEDGPVQVKWWIGGGGAGAGETRSSGGGAGAGLAAEAAMAELVAPAVPAPSTHSCHAMLWAKSRMLAALFRLSWGAQDGDDYEEEEEEDGSESGSESSRHDSGSEGEGGEGGEQAEEEEGASPRSSGSGSPGTASAAATAAAELWQGGSLVGGVPSGHALRTFPVSRMGMLTREDLNEELAEQRRAWVGAVYPDPFDWQPLADFMWALLEPHVGTDTAPEVAGGSTSSRWAEASRWALRIAEAVRALSSSAAYRQRLLDALLKTRADKQRKMDLLRQYFAAGAQSDGWPAAAMAPAHGGFAGGILGWRTDVWLAAGPLLGYHVLLSSERPGKGLYPRADLAVAMLSAAAAWSSSGGVGGGHAERAARRQARRAGESLIEYLADGSDVELTEKVFSFGLQAAMAEHGTQPGHAGAAAAPGPRTLALCQLLEATCRAGAPREARQVAAMFFSEWLAPSGDGSGLCTVVRDFPGMPPLPGPRTVPVVPAGLLLRLLPLVAPMLRSGGTAEAERSGLAAFTVARLRAAQALPPLAVAAAENRAELGAVRDVLSVAAACFPVVHMREPPSSEEQQRAGVGDGSGFQRLAVGGCIATRQEGDVLAAQLMRQIKGSRSVMLAWAAQRKLTLASSSEGDGGQQQQQQQQEEEQQQQGGVAAVQMELALRAALYCPGLLGNDDWAAILKLLRDQLRGAEQQLRRFANQASARLARAAAAVPGLDLGSGLGSPGEEGGEGTPGNSRAGAVQAVAQLQSRGLLGRFPAAQREVEGLEQQLMLAAPGYTGADDSSGISAAEGADGVGVGSVGSSAARTAWLPPSAAAAIAAAAAAAAFQQEQRRRAAVVERSPPAASGVPSTADDQRPVLEEVAASERMAGGGRLDERAEAEEEEEEDVDGGFAVEWSQVAGDVARSSAGLVFGLGAVSALAAAAGGGASWAADRWMEAHRQLCCDLADCCDAAAALDSGGSSGSGGGTEVDAAVDEADAVADALGVDAVSSLLALVLGAPQQQERQQRHGQGCAPRLQACALRLLLRPRLLCRLSSAACLDDADEDEEERDLGGESGADDDAEAVLQSFSVPRAMTSSLVSPEPLVPFLCAWGLLLAHMLNMAPGTRGRARLAQALRDMQGLVPQLLDTLLSIGWLPTTPAELKRLTVGTSAAAGSRLKLYTGPPGVSGLAAQMRELGVPSTEQGVHAMARAVYGGALRALPASSRLWFSDLRDRGLALHLERYTSACESGPITAAELAAVGLGAGIRLGDDKFSIRANTVTREVVSVMTIEDGAVLEMAVRLPHALPLKPPEVECRRKVGVADNRLRKWLLSISAFLRNSNGSVVDAIAMWKTNVDKEFEGVAECLICYSIVAPGTGQLPRLTCRTCKQKWHGSCLYKWFKSSGKSECPHCKSYF